MSKKKELIGLIIGFAGSIAGLLGILWINTNILGQLSVGGYMAVTIASRILLMLIPIVVMIVSKDKLSDYGFSKEKVWLQILLGILLGIASSLIFTLVPHLAGYGEYVQNGHRYNVLWAFIYEFVYFIIGVGLSEEFVFRGFIYEKLRRISNRDSIAVIVSSLMFGSIHLFGGNMLQMIITSFIGVTYCFLRLKIKHCTTLSLIILHGIYDAMITVWASVFMA